MIALKHILVATDFSEASDAALLYAKTLAQEMGSSLHVLHVVHDTSSQITTPFGPAPGGGRILATMTADARRRLKAALTDAERRALKAKITVVTSLMPASAILLYAQDEPVDLIIVGTSGRAGLSRFFLGSVAEQVVRLAPCPVLTVRHPERDFVKADTSHVASTA